MNTPLLPGGWTIRPCQSDDDFDIYARLRNDFLKEYPLSAAQIKDSERISRITGARRWRMLAEFNGEPRLALWYAWADWQSDPGYFEAYATASPDQLADLTAGQELLEILCKNLGATTLLTLAISDYEPIMQMLLGRGYIAGQTYPASLSDLTHFDFDAWITKTEPARQRFAIVNATEFAAQNPDTWIKQFYDFDMEVSADIPMPRPFELIPYDDYVEFLNSPFRSHDCILFVVEDGQIIGTNEICPNSFDSTLGNQYLTGVKREWRRHGIATLLKVEGLRRAASRGIRRVTTENEKSNPMYELNLALGFQTAYHQIAMEKVLV